ncbi:MAG: hypothetical protein ACP5E4_02150 [Candidatus Aenigmatarchaeota archaeon]
MFEPKMLRALCLLFMLALLFSPSLAYVGPIAFLTERVYADYDGNGAASSETYTECNDNANPCRFGFAQVALPNANDTIQTVRVNLSATTNTNLSSVELYRATVTSYPTIWSKTLLYANDSVFGESQNYYKITSADLAPTIVFNITTYTNEQGGSNLYDYDNIGAGGSTNNMSFTITARNPSASKALNGVTVTIYFDTDTGPSNQDAVNITYASAGTPTDSDADGYNDKVVWNGNLAANATQTITLNANIAETVNFNNGVTSLNLDNGLSNKGGKSNYTQTTTLTGLTIAAEFARGPIRQGIDLAEASNQSAWEARGFFRVLSANSSDVGAGTQLIYNISAWNLYNVSASTGNVTSSIQSGTYNSPSIFVSDNGTIYTTHASSSSQSRVVLQGATKPYVASSFTWHVVWNGTPVVNERYYYVSYINTTLDLPTLYKVDQSVTKTLGGYLSVGTATTFNVTDETVYLGDANADGEKIVLLSLVPRNTTGGNSRTAFDINSTSVRVYWYNGTAYNLIKNGSGTDNGVTVTVTDPAGSANGLVNVTINNLSATNVSANLQTTEKIKLTYDVIAPTDLQTGDSFQFTGNTTITSENGTPETEAPSTQTLSTSGRQLVGYKDLWVPNAAQPTVVNGTLVAQVFGNEITGIKFVDYVPLGTNFTCARTSVTFCNSTDGTTWSCGVSADYNVTDKGNVVLNDGTTVHACEYTNSNKSGWSLSSNASVKIMYAINITTSGLYEMPMAIAGFDPALGTEIMASAIGVVRVVVPEPMIDLEITDGEFFTAKSVLVGSPVSWMKDFEVYNPNSRFVDAEFTTEVFEDATNAYVTYVNDKGAEVKEEIVFTTRDGKRHITWKSKLYPNEMRTYDIRILTPPVLETDRDVEIMDVLEGKMVELRMSIFLRSLAAEAYENVQFNLPISTWNIISITDSEGRPIDYSGGTSTRVMIPEMAAGEMKEIVVVYKQAYPKIIITPDKDRYELDSEITLDILVIHGGEEVSYPYIETEVYTPDRDLVYANLQDLGKLEPIAKTNLYERFSVPLGAPEGRYIAESRLMSDMATLATGTGNFYVSGSSGLSAAWINYVLVLLAIGLIYMGTKRASSVKKSGAATQ